LLLFLIKGGICGDKEGVTLLFTEENKTLEEEEEDEEYKAGIAI
jgi:hypothetical protein